jgi:hypothetical protein
MRSFLLILRENAQPGTGTSRLPFLMKMLKLYASLILPK